MAHFSRGTFLLGLSLLAGMVASGQSAGRSTAKVSQNFGKVAPYFEENRGQTDAQARFIARTGNLAAFLTQDGWTLSLHGEVVSMRIADANPKAVFAGEGALEGISNYYLGSRAITGLPHYASVRVTDVRPGIDIVYHGSEHDLEYDFVIRPGGDPNALRLRFEGGSRPVLDGNGDLVFKTTSGELRQRNPRVWQEVDGERKEIDCRYAMSGPSEVKLVLENYNRSAELVIDPVIAYSTYLGGTSDEEATGIAADSFGYAYVTGYTQSADFPVTAGFLHGNYDAYVTKLSTNGSSLIYSTFLGGAGIDRARGIAIDNAGNAYVTGVTLSSDFPFTINHYVGFTDAFVAKFGPTGNVVYCTALGGTGGEQGIAIAVDASGSAYIAGTTTSNDFPATAGSYRTTLAGSGDVFVAKLLPSGQVSYATYLGETNSGIVAIAIDSSGNAFIGGSTPSANFPVTNGAYATTLSGGWDAFVTKLNSTGSALVYSTYLGGSLDDLVSGIAVDSGGNAYVTGNTLSGDFPTTAAAFATVKPLGSYQSGFVSKLNAAGAALVYSTYLGGSRNDLGVAIAVESNGAAYVIGDTQSSNFPTTPGALRTWPLGACCDGDMFLVKVSVDGSALSYSTLLGSTGFQVSQIASALALDGNGGIYISGFVQGTTYPTTSGAYQAVNPKSLAQSYLATAVVTKINFSSPTLCNPSVSPLSQNLPGRGGAISFNLTLSPGCPWEAVPDSFITVSAPAHGVISTSPVTINGTVPLNDSTFSGRTGKVQIGTAAFTVNQDAGSCQDPVISPLSVAFDSSGGIREISLTLPSGCAWVAVSSAPWLTVPTNSSGNGSATITIFAGQNSFSPRMATLTIAGKPITVTQSGSTCTATASATPLSFSAQGGTGLVRITTNSSACQWAAYNAVPWIQVAALGNTGQGSGSVPFIIASNPGSLPRSGQILIADQTLTITQAAGPAGTVNGYTLSSFAGGGSFSTANRGDGGPALAAYVALPYGLAFDPATGNLYIAEYGASRIRVVTPDGNINTFAGGGASTGENVPATSASLGGTSFVAVDTSSSVYVDDSYTRVRAISQGNIATFAGSTSSGFTGDNGPATSAKLSFPQGIAADKAGNTFIADSSNNRIRRVNGGTITTFAGGGNSGLGDNGPATSASLQGPQGIATDSAGNLYIADSGNGRIRKVSQNNISTVAGGGIAGDGGPATSASLSYPFGVAVDPLGDIFIVENNNRLRMVSLDGKISTAAGNGVLGYFTPFGLATDAAGNVYFSDYYNNLVRKLTALPSFCSYSVGTPSTLPAAAGSLPISVTAATGCNWDAASDLAWLTLSSGTPGTGNGTVSFTVSSNPSTSPRTGTIVIAGQAIQVTQAGVPTPATLTIPSNGSTLPGSSVNFQWTTGTGVTQYWLSISKVSVGGGDLFNADPGPGLVTSKTINGLPTDGSTIYVRLYSHIGATWPSLDYTFTALGPASITSPVNGSTLPGTSVNFQWTAGTGVTQYWLSISKIGAGGGDLYNADPGPGLVTSKIINGLPADGSSIYVRLYSHIGTGWPFLDYSYTATGPATITSPVNGSTLPGASVNFQWTTGAGVSQYWLSVSKVGVGGGDLFNADPGPGLVTSKTISGLPTDGSTIYVRLYSHIGSNWPSVDYIYTAAGPATIISPVNGSMLPGASVTFQWTTGTGVTQYWLSISKVGVGGGDLFNADPGPGLVTSKTISGLPTDGSPIYVRLYSHIGSNWPSRDYVYTAFH